MKNRNKRVIEEFGDEWTTFNYSNISKKKLKQNFDEYFNIAPTIFFSNK